VEKLRASEERFRTAFESAATGMMLVDLSGRILQVNRPVVEMLGYTADELLRHTFMDFTDPADLEPNLALFQRAIAGELDRYLFEKRYVHKDGHVVWTRVSTGLVRDADGQPHSLIGQLEDISERKRLEREREAANARLVALQAVTDTALTHLDLDELLHAVLDRIHDVLGLEHAAIRLLEADGRMLGLPTAHMQGDMLSTGAPLDVGQGFAGRVAASRAPLAIDDLTEFPFVNRALGARLRSAVGVPLLLDERLLGVLYAGTTTPRHFADHEVGLLQLLADRVAVAIDRARLYEAERQAHAQAAARTAELEAVLNGVTDGVVVYDREGRGTYVNPALRAVSATHVPPEYERLSLSKRAVVVGMRTPAGEIVPEDQLPQARLLRGEVLAGAASPDLLFDAPDGRTLTVQYAGSPLRDAAGAISGAVMVLRNVTDERRLQRATQELAAQLQATLDAMTDAVFLYDPEGRELRLNAAAQALVEEEPKVTSVAGTDWWEHVRRLNPRRPDGQPLRLEEWPLTRVLRGETLTSAEAHDVVLTDAQGHEQVLTYVGGPVQDAFGKLMGYVFVVRDITARWQLERTNAEQADQLTRVFEGITDGLVLYDARGHVVRSNGAARRILGVEVAQPAHARQSAYERTLLYAVRDAQGRALAPEERPLIRVLRGKVEAGAETQSVQLRTLDGREVELTVSAAPLWDGEGHLLGAVTILHDQTEHNQLEREREAARARALALQEVNERLDTFVAMAAHDLRHPVGVAKMAVEGARRRIRQTAAGARSARGKQLVPFAQVETALETTARQLDRLLRLVQQLLDVSRVRQGTLVLDRQPCDLAALVRQAVDEQRLLSPARTIAVSLPELPDAAGTAGQPVLVEADADRLGQVLANYLSNAERYSPDDQPIAVALRRVAGAAGGKGAGEGGEAGEAGEEVARVEVRDHGPGIALEEQTLIWERFQRAHTASEAGGGLGLGLYIVRMVVEQHGGQAGVESEVGQGSTFWFTLPLAPTTPAAVPANQADTASGSPVRSEATQESADGEDTVP
jgi:PAS domain S-box-containing protein